MDILAGSIKLVIGIAIVLVMFRLLKKELAQITPVDLLFILILGELFGGVAHTPDIPIWHIILVAIWGIIIWITEKVVQNKKLQKIIEGEPQILIKNGVIIREVMKKNRLNEKEIQHKLRERGIFDLKEVELGILEISGSVTAKRKEKNGQ